MRLLPTQIPKESWKFPTAEGKTLTITPIRTSQCLEIHKRTSRGYEGAAASGTAERNFESGGLEIKIQHLACFPGKLHISALKRSCFKWEYSCPSPPAPPSLSALLAKKVSQVGEQQIETRASGSCGLSNAFGHLDAIVNWDERLPTIQWYILIIYVSSMSITSRSYLISKLGRFPFQ